MLTYTFEDRGDESLYAHLYHNLRLDIEAGVISPDEKLPSKRQFAKHLGVSLITVEGAYTQLLAEGYIRSVPRVGYFANRLQRSSSPNANQKQTASNNRIASCCSLEPLSRSSKSPCESQSGDTFCTSIQELQLVQNFETSQSSPSFSPHYAGLGIASCDNPARCDLAPDKAGFSPDPPSGSSSATEATFPLAAWSRTVRDVLAHEPESELIQQSPSMGLSRLQKALAQYVRAFRGLDISPEQILIASGAQTIYSLLIQLNGRRTPMAVESPGYPRLVQIYRHNEVPLSCVGLDDEGVSMAQLRASGAQGVHLMPSHQFPTGIVTPISRRYELLSWATEEPGRFIIEDDYDCEFRLTGRPIPTMKSIDTENCVIYTNTFTRSLGPSFRVGFAVLPQPLLERYRRDLGFYSCTVSTIEQIALARFIESGDLERHINRMRTQCRTRRDKLMAALETAGLGSLVTLRGAEAGLHFLLVLPVVYSETQVINALRRAHIAATPLSRFCMDTSLAGKNPTTIHAAQLLNAYVISYADLTDIALDSLIVELQLLLQNNTDR